MHLPRGNLFPNIVGEGNKPFLLIICSSISAMLGSLDSYAADIILSGSKTEPLIVINGDLNPGDGDRFSIIANSVGNARVSLNSNGGNLFSGLQIGTIIRSKGFSTVVDPGSLCASACGLVWFAGSPRYFNDQSKIGFHSAYQVVNGKAQETGVGNALVGAYLSRLGASDRTIVFFTLANPNQINWLTPSVAKELGIRYAEIGDEKAVSSPNNRTYYSTTKTQLSAIEVRAYRLTLDYFDYMMKDKETARYFLQAALDNNVIVDERFQMKPRVIADRIEDFFRLRSRFYEVNSDSIEIYCESDKSCEVSGQFIWAGFSNENENGVGSFKFYFDFTKGPPKIIGDTIFFTMNN